MRMVIDIPEEKYQTILNHTEEILDASSFIEPKYLYRAVLEGTPLPKGHGRIKDIDKIEWYGCTTEFNCPHDLECKDCNRGECNKTQVDAIPTIIEADKIESEEL